MTDQILEKGTTIRRVFMKFAYNFWSASIKIITDIKTFFYSASQHKIMFLLLLCIADLISSFHLALFNHIG